MDAKNVIRGLLTVRNASVDHDRINEAIEWIEQHSEQEPTWQSRLGEEDILCYVSNEKIDLDDPEKTIRWVAVHNRDSVWPYGTSKGLLYSDAIPVQPIQSKQKVEND